MNGRRLAALTFVLGIAVAPLVFALMRSTTSIAVAQEEDLIVVQPMLDEDNPVDCYLELARQKAKLLDPEELARETERLRVEIRELEATRKLREAERQLQIIIDEHPGSAAAGRAQMMLNGLRAQEETTRNRSTLSSGIEDPNQFPSPRTRDRTRPDSDSDTPVPARNRRLNRQPE